MHSHVITVNPEEFTLAPLDLQQATTSLARLWVRLLMGYISLSWNIYCWGVPALGSTQMTWSPCVCLSMSIILGFEEDEMAVDECQRQQCLAQQPPAAWPVSTQPTLHWELSMCPKVLYNYCSVMHMMTMTRFFGKAKKNCTSVWLLIWILHMYFSLGTNTDCKQSWLPI